MLSSISTALAASGARPADRPSETLRVGDIIEARINAMSEDGVAHLAVAGTALAVRTPVPLPPGTIVKLVVRQLTDRGPTLALDLSGTGTASVHRPAIQDADGRPVVRGLALLNALLSVVAPPISASPVGKQIGYQRLDHAAPAADHSQEARGGAGHIQTAQGEQVGEAVLGASSRPADGSSGDRVVLASSVQEGRAMRDPGATTERTFVLLPLPGTTGILQVDVAEAEEDAGHEHPGGARRSATARFSFASDALGHVHAVVRQCDGAVHVSLWAERPDVADGLREDRAALTEALLGAGVAVGVIEITAGFPSPPAELRQ